MNINQCDNESIKIHFEAGCSTVVIMQDTYHGLGEINFYVFSGAYFKRSYYTTTHTVAIFKIKPKLIVTDKGHLNYAA